MRMEMQALTAAGPRGSVVRPELQPVIEGLDFVPKRLPRRGAVPARTLLRRDGAVILTDWPVEADSAVNAAAMLLGTRLRTLEQVAGEVLILDNYRCLHGVRAHGGTRTVHVLRCKSAEA